MNAALLFSTTILLAQAPPAAETAPPVGGNAPAATVVASSADAAPAPTAPKKSAAVTVPWDPDVPPWNATKTRGDFSTRLGALTPADYRRWVLVGVETAVPVVASTAAAMFGTVVGGVAGWILFARARDVTRVPVSGVLAGGTLFGFALGALAMFLADAVMSSGHPERLWPSRLVGLLLLAPVPLALGAYGVMQAVGYYRLGPYTQATASALAWTGWGLSYTVLPLAALAACVTVRIVDLLVRGP